MRLLRIDASLRTEGSVSRALADAAEAAWRAAAPDAEVVRRDLGGAPLPPVWPAAAFAGRMPPAARTSEQRVGAALAAALVDELLCADAVLLAAPLYNFGVPQQVKHWVDLVICDPRANDVNVPLLPGRPGLIVVARGGGYGPGTPRDGWDHSTPYLQRILGDVWGLELTTVAAELTAASYDPAMAHLAAAAAAQFDAARSAAQEAMAAAAAGVRRAA
jgi:FMN-dependent NADH-azoreductase